MKQNKNRELTEPDDKLVSIWCPYQHINKGDVRMAAKQSGRRIFADFMNIDIN
jgi:hypothetical protein